MSYTDKQMKDATQLAYMKCFSDAEKRLINSGKQRPFTVRELIEASFSKKDARLKAMEFGDVPDALNFKELLKYSNLSEGDIERISLLNDECLDWKVVDIHDKNDVNGFYGCVLETKDSEAIIAFRGSESDGNNLINDWLLADLGLLNSTKTNQQAETERYADELLEKGIIDKYDFIATTGHSLGGNLATHLNVISAVKGREKLYEKLKQVVNMDGPGMSHDYLQEYANEIARTSHKLTHYKWSAIGDLLFSVPGEEVEFLDSDESILGDMNSLKKAFWRHDTRTIDFTEEGEAKRGKKDKLSNVLGPVYRLVDKKVRDFIMTAVLAKIENEFISIDQLKDGIASIAKDFMAKSDKKPAMLDVLTATFKDREINRSSLDVATKTFNELKDKVFGLEKEENDNFVRA